MVVIDSINGYLNAMPDERFLTTHLHELLTYLGQRGVVTILVGVQQGMLGGSMSTTVDASYLADNVLMLRYFEHDGEVKQAVSVFKKRGSLHERTIRQFSMSADGIHVGRGPARIPRHPDRRAGLPGSTGVGGGSDAEVR